LTHNRALVFILCPP